MPTPIPKHRTYCKTCNSFKIHTWKSQELVCDTCETVFSSYFPNQIDQNIVQEQRERYKKQEIKNVTKLFTYLGTNHSFPQTAVTECDAGQEDLDNKRKELNRQIQLQKHLLIDDYNANYKHLSRNDKCSCGSNKKFKQCHLLIFREKGLNL